jgi:outer membrane biosynthesis protein TonB
MLPQVSPVPEQNPTRINLLISLAFHCAIVLALVYFAARGGILGEQLRKISIEMVKETPPEKPKPPEKQPAPPPGPEPPKPVEHPAVEAAQVQAPKPISQAPPPALLAAPAPIAPPAADLPSFEFGGGRTVQTSSDPVLLYNSLVESTLRSKWRRPANIADDDYVADVEVAVDHDGQISDPVWKKGSGDPRWDDTVRQAISATRSLGRPPPAGFPARVLVRFDVQDVTEPVGTGQ